MIDRLWLCSTLVGVGISSSICSCSSPRLLRLESKPHFALGTLCYVKLYVGIRKARQSWSWILFVEKVRSRSEERSFLCEYIFFFFESHKRSIFLFALIFNCTFLPLQLFPSYFSLHNNITRSKQTPLQNIKMGSTVGLPAPKLLRKPSSPLNAYILLTHLPYHRFTLPFIRLLCTIN